MAETSINFLDAAVNELVQGTYMLDYIKEGRYEKSTKGVLDYIHKEVVKRQKGGTFSYKGYDIGFYEFTKKGFKVMGDGCRLITYVKYSDMAKAAFHEISKKVSDRKVNIKIETEFKELLPPLTPEQKEELERDIVKNGCLNPLIVWGDILIDGHHRYEICTKNDIPYDILEMKFKDKLEAMEWAWSNQKNRRNLNKYELAQIALKFKPVIEEKAKEKQLSSLKQNTVNQISDKREETEKSAIEDKKSINTLNELSKISGVSHDTIHKVEYIEKKAPEDIKVKAKTGQLTINSAYNLTKETIETKKKNEEAEKEYQQQLEIEKLEKGEKKQQEEIKKSLPKNVVLLSKHEHQEKHIFGITDFNKMTGEQFDKCLDYTRKYQNVISKVAELSIDKDSLAAWNCTLEKQEEVFLELSTLEVAINNLTVIQNFFKGVKKHE